MKSAYSLVAVSIIAASVLFLGIAFYRFVYPKRIIPYPVLLLLLGFLPLISIFRPGSYESGDLSLHTMRTISFYHILFIEHQLPQWTPEFNVSYGDPYFLFAYFLPYLLGAVFHAIGFSYLASIKLLLMVSYLLSGLFLYIFAKDIVGKQAGFVSAIFYLFVPYHLVDLHFRVTIAETLSFVFLPLCLLFTRRVLLHPTIRSVLSGSFVYALLILTHQVISLIFIPFSVAYAMLLFFTTAKKALRNICLYALMLVFGFLLAAFYWLPVLTEAKYTQASMTKGSMLFTSFQQLLITPWIFGFLFQGHKGELGLIVGYTQIFVLLAIGWLVMKHQLNKEKTQLALFLLVSCFLYIFMILPQSKPIWQLFPLLQFAQFSYRLLEVVALCTSLLAGILVTKWCKPAFIFSLIVITIGYTMLNWGNRKNLPQVTDSYLTTAFAKKPDVGQYLEPSSPIWVSLEKSKLRVWPKQHLEILSGIAETKEVQRSATMHTYIVSVQKQIHAKENTLYFPGWTVYVNGKSHAIDYMNPQYPGIITFFLPKGLYETKVVYQHTPDRILGLVTSILSAGIFLIVFFLALCKSTRVVRLLRRE